MSLSYSDIQPLLAEGKSHAEIASHFNTQTKHNRAIPLGEMNNLLRRRDMLVRTAYEDPTTKMKWTGSIVNMIVGLRAMSHPALGEVNKWFSHLTDAQAEIFDLTDEVYSDAMEGLKLAVGGMPGMPSIADFEAISELAGGKRYANVTEQSVLGILNAESARQSLERIRSRRQAWDAIAADIRSRIESGALPDNAAVLAAVQSAF